MPMVSRGIRIPFLLLPLLFIAGCAAMQSILGDPGVQAAAKPVVEDLIAKHLGTGTSGGTVQLVALGGALLNAVGSAFPKT